MDPELAQLCAKKEALVKMIAKKKNLNEKSVDAIKHRTTTQNQNAELLQSYRIMQDALGKSGGKMSSMDTKTSKVVASRIKKQKCLSSKQRAVDKKRHEQMLKNMKALQKVEDTIRMFAKNGPSQQSAGKVEVSLSETESDSSEMSPSEQKKTKSDGAAAARDSPKLMNIGSSIGRVGPSSSTGYSAFGGSAGPAGPAVSAGPAASAAPAAVASVGGRDKFCPCPQCPARDGGDCLIVYNDDKSIVCKCEGGCDKQFPDCCFLPSVDSDGEENFGDCCDECRGEAGNSHRICYCCGEQGEAEAHDDDKGDDDDDEEDSD